MKNLIGGGKSSFLVRAAGACLVAVLLTGCAGVGVTVNRDSSFQVKVTLERTTPFLRVGDDVVVNVQSDRPCYLQVFYIGRSGAINRIFPDDLRRDSRVAAGAISRIPQTGAPYRLTLTPPPGRETVLAVATLEPVELIPRDRLNYSGVLPKVELTRSEFETTVMASLEKISSTAWSIDTYNFTYER
jgi:hypothetical protein